MGKSGNKTVGVEFDRDTLSVLEKRALLRYGSISGRIQFYIRDATMKQLREDAKLEDAAHESTGKAMQFS